MRWGTLCKQLCRSGSSTHTAHKTANLMRCLCCCWKMQSRYKMDMHVHTHLNTHTHTHLHTRAQARSSTYVMHCTHDNKAFSMEICTLQWIYACAHNNKAFSMEMCTLQLIYYRSLGLTVMHKTKHVHIITKYYQWKCACRSGFTTGAWA